MNVLRYTHMCICVPCSKSYKMLMTIIKVNSPKIYCYCYFNIITANRAHKRATRHVAMCLSTHKLTARTKNNVRVCMFALAYF